MRSKLKQTKLYSKILEVFNNICEDKNITIQMILKKGNMTSEIEMINMLAKIELGLDELITKNRIFLNGPKASEYKSIQIQIEKEHKIKKTILQRFLDQFKDFSIIVLINPCVNKPISFLYSLISY